MAKPATSTQHCPVPGFPVDWETSRVTCVGGLWCFLQAACSLDSSFHFHFSWCRELRSSTRGTRSLYSAEDPGLCLRPKKSCGCPGWSTEPINPSAGKPRQRLVSWLVTAPVSVARGVRDGPMAAEQGGLAWSGHQCGSDFILLSPSGHRQQSQGGLGSTQGNLPRSGCFSAACKGWAPFRALGCSRSAGCASVPPSPLPTGLLRALSTTLAADCPPRHSAADVSGIVAAEPPHRLTHTPGPWRASTACRVPAPGSVRCCAVPHRRAPHAHCPQPHRPLGSPADWGAAQGNLLPHGGGLPPTIQVSQHGGGCLLGAWDHSRGKSLAASGICGGICYLPLLSLMPSVEMLCCALEAHAALHQPPASLISSPLSCLPSLPICLRTSPSPLRGSSLVCPFLGTDLGPQPFPTTQCWRAGGLLEIVSPGCPR